MQTSSCSSQVTPLGTSLRALKPLRSTHSDPLVLNVLTCCVRSRHSPEHIRFHSPSRAAVRECYTAALYAGARPLHPPGDRINRIRDGEVDVFNTFVMDRDGNNIEVTYGHHDEYDRSYAGSEFKGTAIRGWQRNVADEYVPTRAATEVHSFASRRRTERTSASARHSYPEQSAPSHMSKRASSRSATVPVAVPPPPPEGFPMPSLMRQLSGPVETMLGKTDGISGSVPMKLVAGTALGAAAGAAFAYAMCKSEDGTTTREQWRYSNWGNHSQNLDSHDTTVLPGNMSRLAIEAPARSRVSGPPMAYDRYDTRSRAATQVEDDWRSRRRSSPHASEPERRSSSRVSRSQSVREPSARDGSSSRRSARAASAHSARRDESRHSHHSRTSHTLVDPPPVLTRPTGRSSSNHSTITALRDAPPRSGMALIAAHAGALVDEPSDMDLDGLDDETVVPSDSISCAGDKYSRRSAGRSLKSSSHGVDYRASDGYRHPRDRGSRHDGRGMKSFHDRMIDIERAGGSVDAPISARRVARMVY